MAAPQDDYRLEEVAAFHEIAADLFFPFVITRVRQEETTTEAILTVRLRGLGETEEERSLRLTWSPTSVPSQPLGVQENTITEWAALGLACVVMARYAGLRLRAVAVPGDRFDFWATDGQQHYGLEVSGTLAEDLEARHREKVRQLRDNPHRVDGYVVAVRFASREVLLSFNRFAEGKS